MAKNRKQNRSQQKQASTESAQERSRTSAMEAEGKAAVSQATPGDMARKHRERRFGHN
jgi:hypothetical protein